MLRAGKSGTSAGLGPSTCRMAPLASAQQLGFPVLAPFHGRWLLQQTFFFLARIRSRGRRTKPKRNPATSAASSGSNVHQ